MVNTPQAGNKPRTCGDSIRERMMGQLERRVEAILESGEFNPHAVANTLCAWSSIFLFGSVVFVLQFAVNGFG